MREALNWFLFLLRDRSEAHVGVLWLIIPWNPLLLMASWTKFRVHLLERCFLKEVIDFGTFTCGWR